MSNHLSRKIKTTLYHWNMNKKDDFGKVISQLRIDRGLTQKELAEKMEISSTLITDYERGKLRLHGEIIVKLADVLQVSADEILGRKTHSGKEDSANSLRIMKRVRNIESLPQYKQKIILQMIDAYVKSEEIK